MLYVQKYIERDVNHFFDIDSGSFCRRAKRSAKSGKCVAGNGVAKAGRFRLSQISRIARGRRFIQGSSDKSKSGDHTNF